METLKKTIESTLINNLEAHDDFHYDKPITIESIQTCSDYIAQEIRDVALEFAHYFYTRQDIWHNDYEKHEEELFNDFIKERYNEK